MNRGTRKNVSLFLDVLGRYYVLFKSTERIFLKSIFYLTNLLYSSGGPYLNITIEPYYMVNREAAVVCTVLGNPLPIVEWSFRPCNLQQPTADCEIRESDKLLVS